MKKSLFIKFLSGFSLVIIISTLMIVFSIRIVTKNQYTNVVNQNDVQMAEDISPVIGALYEQERGWEGISDLLGFPVKIQEQSLRGQHRGQAMPGPMMGMRMGFSSGSITGVEKAEVMFLRMVGVRERILLTDTEGHVVADSEGRLFGERVSSAFTREGVQVFNEEIPVGRIYVGSMIEPVLSRVDKLFLDRLNFSILYSAMAGLALSFLLTLFFFRKITDPIRELSEASIRISRGDYGATVKQKGGYEIEGLAKSFNIMTEALKKSDQWKRQIISDAAHELRTPVSLIKANLELIMDGVYKPDRNQLASMSEEVDRLARLIEELQLLSSAEAGSVMLKRDLVSIPEIIKKICLLFLPKTERKNIRIIDKSEEDVPLVLGDEMKLTQVFSNILSNALKVTPAGEEIQIHTSFTKEGVLTVIKDYGPGIAGNQIELIFERFYRQESSRSREDGGTGLGLAISRSIILAHGGKLWAESDGKNGSSFFTLLPSLV